MEAAETDLGEVRAAASKTDSRRMGRIQRTGVWLSVLPSTVNRTELGAQEWRYSIFLSYGINPPDLPYHCDGDGLSFSVFYVLNCKKGSLIVARHNELCSWVTDLEGKAFTPVHVCDDPKFSQVAP